MTIPDGTKTVQNSTAVDGTSFHDVDAGRLVYHHGYAHGRGDCLIDVNVEDTVVDSDCVGSSGRMFDHVETVDSTVLVHLAEYNLLRCDYSTH